MSHPHTRRRSRMSLAASFIAAVVASALSACSNPAAPQGNYGTITGKIMSNSGRPVAGATITVDYSITATSKADGAYTVQTVPVTTPAAPAIVQVTAQGYQTPPPRSDVQVQSGASVQVNFTLTPS
ncbi:MAG: carboxypeptidase regulatory-like domain-containing protein [Candidatus Eremiobacteraeota bacterium]|nr:carboxypeptidase regulatory-like domain-containing protein [Candidatus Eremiobacteraeota bacterium]